MRAAAAALKDGRNQYPPMTGVLELREAVARPTTGASTGSRST